MSLYVRVSTGFYAHIKTLRLRVALGDDAFWVPPRLWAYAAQHKPDGVFENYSASELAMLIGYTGDAQAMLQALLQAGFMDENPLRLHDWAEHNSYHTTFAERAKKAAEARWSKAKGATLNGREKEKEKEKETSIATSMLDACYKHAAGLLGYLNEKAGRQFQPCAENLRLIRGRLADCANDVDGCRQMIDRQVKLWRGDAKMEEYLRPQTLFARTNFRSYYDDRLRPVPNGRPVNQRNVGVSNDVDQQSNEIAAAVAAAQQRMLNELDR